MELAGDRLESTPATNSETAPNWGDEVLRFPLTDKHSKEAHVLFTVCCGGTFGTCVCAVPRDMCACGTLRARGLTRRGADLVWCALLVFSTTLGFARLTLEDFYTPFSHLQLSLDTQGSISVSGRINDPSTRGPTPGYVVPGAGGVDQGQSESESDHGEEAAMAAAAVEWAAAERRRHEAGESLRQMAADDATRRRQQAQPRAQAATDVGVSVAGGGRRTVGAECAPLPMSHARAPPLSQAVLQTFSQLLHAAKGAAHEEKAIVDFRLWMERHGKIAAQLRRADIMACFPNRELFSQCVQCVLVCLYLRR